MRQLNAGDMYAKSKLRIYGKALTLLMQVVPLRTHTLNSYMECINKTNWYFIKNYEGQNKHKTFL